MDFGMVLKISQPHMWGFLAGCLTTTLLPPLVRLCIRFITGDGSAKKIYGLHHAVLNIELPPRTMWMNMGYWENGSNFPSACRRLLTEVLYTADLIDRDGHRIRRHPVRIIDLGIGCGDQTVTLLKDYPSLFESYVGITIDSTQFDFAKHRLSSFNSPEHFAYGTPNTEPYQPTEQEDRSGREEEWKDSTIDETTVLQKKLEEYVSDVNGKTPKTVRIFCTDAAQPSKWSAELNEAIIPNLNAESIKTPLSKLKITGLDDGIRSTSS
ncbi:hypothetical protein N7G274_000672 [Stereocaulon virgatum]|uniref:S-adenosyl-L-methionine-dependent methyltransferase n=1 Tax=Stereocaulon virgatum TaxID=373712 RepID=A0ABR4API3_9LECA